MIKTVLTRTTRQNISLGVQDREGLPTLEHTVAAVSRRRKCVNVIEIVEFFF
jgi:hypothetical protein